MKTIKGLCVLDVDGTLIEEEVIDLLGKESECEEEVALLTAQAMRGELDFEKVSLLMFLIGFIMNFTLVKTLPSLLKFFKKIR